MGLAKRVKARAEFARTEYETLVATFLVCLFDRAILTKKVEDAMVRACVKGADEVSISTSLGEGWLRRTFNPEVKKFGEIPDKLIQAAIQSHQLGKEIKDSELIVGNVRHNYYKGHIDIRLERE